MVSKTKKRFIWLSWIIIWPLVLWISYNYYFIHVEHQLIDILLFASFMILVALFPLKINNYQLFFTNGISIVVFLMFGLFVEILLTQIVIVTVLFNVGVRDQESYRFPLNMLSISIVSLISAEVFYVVGGTHGAANYESPYQLAAAVMYGLSVLVLNMFFNKLIDRFFYNRKFKYFGKGEKWEFTTLLLVLPVGYVLYILYAEIGTAGIFYLGVPFVFISVIIQLLYSYQELNDYLGETSRIGHLLTKNLLKDEVYDIFLNELKNLIAADYIRVFLEEEGELALKRFYNRDTSITKDIAKLKNYSNFSKYVWETKEPLVFQNSGEWINVIQHDTYDSIESIVSLPIEYDNDVIGVVTIASQQKRKFENFHIEILDILTTYLGIAIQNAENLELTKLESNIDGLTKVYNYKYFQSVIESQENTYKVEGNIAYYSLLLLDIDHFKRVNDTYGHETGNEILYQLANRLVNKVGDEGLVARYGGEEFAIFLPGYSLESAYEMAEKIRNDIINHEYISHQHILTREGPINISITVSIGVASYPDHCKSLTELVRHADRAMYVGAKSRGRNRIAIYEDVL